MPIPLCRRIACIALLVCLAVRAGQAAAPTAWYEGFEGPDVSWRLAGGNASAHVAIHQREQGQAHTGQSCERLAISAGPGTAVYIVHDVGQPLVIEELLPSVWVKSDRSGLQLLAEVSLPRTIDPRTGRPVSTLVAGTSYTQIGAWQQLRVDDIERGLGRQIRALRAELGTNVDDREAYVERIVLNLYGGPGWTNVWIDDLDIRAHVARTVSSVSPSMPAAPAGDLWVAAGSGPVAGSGGLAASQPSRVRLADTALLIDNRPFFPRLLQYRGEPLALVQQLGFNGIWLSQPPPLELLREAESLGLWIVCPPPAPRDPESGSAMAEIGSQYDRVLAWHLGAGLGQNQLEAVRRWCDQIRTADRRGARPLIGDPQADLRSYSRYFDLLVQSARPLGSSMELSDYAAWLRARALLARPGTPFWTTIQTQYVAELAQQLGLLDPARPLTAQPSPEQIRLMAYAAIAAGSHGLLFESYSPLTADDPVTRQRAMVLELVNLELGLAEPWAGNGTYQSTVSANCPDVGGSLLRAEHKRLLLSAWQGPGSQYVVGPSPKQPVSLVIPGLPESTLAFDLLPGGLRPLKRERVSGGTQIMLEDFALVRPVMLVQDPSVIGVLGRMAAAAGPRAAELHRNLAVRRLYVVQEILGQLGRAAQSGPQVNEALTHANTALQRCESQRAAKEWQAACDSAEAAMSELRGLERSLWDRTVQPLPSPMASAGTTGFTTLPWHARLTERLAASRPGENRLPAGNLDDLNAVMAAGWIHFENHIDGVRSSADLTPIAAHWGQRGMRLIAQVDDPKNPSPLGDDSPAGLDAAANNPRQKPSPSGTPSAAHTKHKSAARFLLPNGPAQTGHPAGPEASASSAGPSNGPEALPAAPVTILSPEVQVRQGELLCIRGWVFVPKPIGASPDKLMIADTLYGEALAERIGQTQGWKPFILYRIAPRYGTFRVSFTLCGLGEAYLDDITIQTVDPVTGNLSQSAPAPAMVGAPQVPAQP